jgi:hypothetical protein
MVAYLKLMKLHYVFSKKSKGSETKDSNKNFELRDLSWEHNYRVSREHFRAEDSLCCVRLVTHAPETEVHHTGCALRWNQ